MTRLLIAFVLLPGAACGDERTLPPAATEDGGAPALDAGRVIPMDDGGGSPPLDAGRFGDDAGRPPSDAGRPIADAGTDACRPATEICNGVDDDCDGVVDGSGCSSVGGSYAGSYEMYTVERLGSTIINQMRCNSGTSTITVDVAASPAVTGTVQCTYTGGLTRFSRSQSGTVEGEVRPDGTVDGRLFHQFDSSDSGTRRTISFTGTIAARRLQVMATSSWRPHPMSAVPWDIEASIDASR